MPQNGASDAHQAGAPGEAAAHCFEHDEVTRLDPSVAQPVIEGKRHGCGRGVGVQAHGLDHPFRRQVQFPRGRVQNPLIRLMRHHPVDIGG